MMERLLRSKYAPLLLPLLLGVLLFTHASVTRRKEQKPTWRYNGRALSGRRLVEPKSPPGRLRLPPRVAPIDRDPSPLVQSNQRSTGATSPDRQRLVPEKVLSSAVEAAWKEEIRRLPPVDQPTPAVDLIEEGKQPSSVLVKTPTDTAIDIIQPEINSTDDAAKEVPPRTDSNPGKNVVSDPVVKEESEQQQEQTAKLPKNWKPEDMNPASPETKEPPSATMPSAVVMGPVAQRANEHIRHGFVLAQRGAFYSARAEFIQALRLISQALDVHRGGRWHSRNLARGLRALTEADDFVPRGSQLEADLDMTRIVAAHRTPVLQGRAAEVSPLEALQKYYTFSQESLAKAGGRQPSASLALYGLGKVHAVLGVRSAEKNRLAGPKALALQQAALLSDMGNFRAANELGVLLARYGQLPAARKALLHSVQVRPQAETWHNLSVVHQQMGEADLARRAHYEWHLMTKEKRPATNGPESQTAVRWVDPQTFQRSYNGAEGAIPHRPQDTALRKPVRQPNAYQNPAYKKSPTAWRWPWQKKTR